MKDFFSNFPPQILNFFLLFFPAKSKDPSLVKFNAEMSALTDPELPQIPNPVDMIQMPLDAISEGGKMLPLPEGVPNPIVIAADTASLVVAATGMAIGSLKPQ